MSLPNKTYIDSYIEDGHKETLSLNNLYETMLVGDVDKPDHIIRIPFDDFFLKYKDQLNSIIQYYNVPEYMFYKPKMLSYELYGTTELWLALLRVNNMRNITEFHKPIIRVYNSNDLKTLINIFFKRENKIT